MAEEAEGKKPRTDYPKLERKVKPSNETCPIAAIPRGPVVASPALSKAGPVTTNKETIFNAATASVSCAE